MDKDKIIYKPAERVSADVKEEMEIIVKRIVQLIKIKHT